VTVWQRFSVFILEGGLWGGLDASVKAQLFKIDARQSGWASMLRVAESLQSIGGDVRWKFGIIAGEPSLAYLSFAISAKVQVRHVQGG
jgi:hypothetical protein